MELEFLYNFCKILKAACLLGILGMKMRFLVGYMGEWRKRTATVGEEGGFEKLQLI